MKPYIFPLLMVFTLAACGSQRAVRPEAPAPVIAETQTYTINYRSAKGQKITAVYLNSHSPLTAELHQGNTVETLTQVSTWAKGAEYANPTTRWQVQEGWAELTRKNKKTRFNETD